MPPTQRAFFIHCLSPLHAGTGQAVDLIDLPIARYRATGIPFLPGSSIKGVVRDARTPPNPRPGARTQLDADATWSRFLAAFGPDVGDEASEHAGAVAFGDARLLVMPIRSLRGTFAYATCPLLLRLATQDIERAGLPATPPIPDIKAPATSGDDQGIPHALVPQDPASVLLHANRLFLEDLDFLVAADPRASAWAKWIGERVFPSRTADLARRFVIIDDEAMSFLWETATQVDAHNRINERGTVADGQLWYQENLPPETVLIGVATATVSRRKNAVHDEAAMLDLALPNQGDFLQFGGKATTGKGRARFLPLT